MYDCVVIGGGLAGMAASWRLASRGQRVLLLEKGEQLGGLASSFEQSGRLYPLGYHHILSSDDHLLAFLARLGLLDRVHWKRLEMGFYIDGETYGLGRPSDFVRFPLSWPTKLRMAARTGLAWMPMRNGDEPASDWLQRITGESAITEFFDRLTQIKFGLPTSALSAYWLRARLRAGEGGCNYGYIPNADWVSVMVDNLHRKLIENGVEIRLNSEAVQLETNEAQTRVNGVTLRTGDTISTRCVLGALAPPLMSKLMPSADPNIDSIEYTGVISTVLATRQEVPIERYWTNFLQPYRSFGGIFRLDLLNNTLGHPGMRVLNFCTHIKDRGPGSMLRCEPNEIEAQYLTDFEKCFGMKLKPEWVHTSRIPYYSPVFVSGYTNPPVQSDELNNVFFAGNHRTFPVLATTGSAMGSGWEAAASILRTLAVTPKQVEDIEAA
jgi:protoporphyrinogen oxidase